MPVNYAVGENVDESKQHAKETTGTLIQIVWELWGKRSLAEALPEEQWEIQKSGTQFGPYYGNTSQHKHFNLPGGPTIFSLN